MKLSSLIYSVLTMICAFAYIVLRFTNSSTANCVFWVAMAVTSLCVLIKEIKTKRRISPNNIICAPRYIKSDLIAKSFVDEKDWIWYKHYRERTYEAIEFWKSQYVRSEKLLSNFIIYISATILFGSLHCLILVII